MLSTINSLGGASAAPIFARYAENTELWDVEGRRYVDFAGGIAVLNTGHRQPAALADSDAAELKHAVEKFG